MRLLPFWTGCLLVLSLFPCAHALAQSSPPSRHIDVDDPADEEILNREIWETMKGLPYTVATSHAARRQKEGSSRDATVALPTGWKIAPAGTQAPVGRLPYMALPFGGRIVVLNNGYYTGTAKPEVFDRSIPARAPCAAPSNSTRSSRALRPMAQTSSSAAGAAGASIA